MNEADQQQRALSALEGVRQELHPEIDESLIQSIYRIQVRTQFDEDRSEAVRYVEKTLRDYVDRKLSGEK